MDYEKLHKDTIAKLQEMVNRGKITAETARGICADFVPESEDKMMIKFIKNQLFNIKKTITENYELDAKLTKAIDWLEKQGEQKPKFRVGDTIKCKYDDRQFTIKSVDLDKGTYTYTQEGCGNDIDYADEKFELVEQKPADKVEPKQELSNWDKTIIESIEALCDEKIESVVYQDIKEHCNDIKEWLKSLRPQNRWKPSDEQMNALSVAVKHGQTDDPDALKKLLEQLKKLREE